MKRLLALVLTLVALAAPSTGPAATPASDPKAVRVAEQVLDALGGRARWEYVLQGNAPPPVRWTWEGWEEHDGLWFPTAHRRDRTVVFTRDVETSAGFPAGTFGRP